MIGIKIEKDAPIPMRDGLKLAANIYHHEKPGQYPVIMAFTSTVTGLKTFEANDPAYCSPRICSEYR